MNDNPPVAAGVEMGGTKCVLLLARGPDDVIDRRRLPTRDPETTLRAIEAILAEWRQAYGFAAVGIAGFGPLDLDPTSATYGAIVASPKPGWSGTNPRARLAPLFDVPVALDTDVNGAALAENLWGAAQGTYSNCYVTVGTGVGVGVISNGRPLMGLSHGELGHMKVGRLPGDDWPGACPYHGDCVEGLTSGPAIAARTGRRGEDVPGDHHGWLAVEHALTGLLHNIVLTVAPEHIAIGGGVVGARSEMIPQLRRRLVESLNGYGATARFTDGIETRLSAPGLGDLAGPLGPIALAQAALGPRRAANV